jgi:hypothetical protein
MGESSPVKTRLSLTNSGICPSTIVHCSAQVEQHRACSGQHSTMTPSSNPYLPPPVVRGPSSRAAPSSSPAGRGRVIPPPQGCSHTLERELAFFLGITRPTPALSLTRCHPQLPRERTSFTYPPFVPFTMCATAREDHIRSFGTDLERLTANHRGWAPLDGVKSTNTTAPPPGCGSAKHSHRYRREPCNLPPEAPCRRGRHPPGSRRQHPALTESCIGHRCTGTGPRTTPNNVSPGRSLLRRLGRMLIRRTAVRLKPKTFP